MSEQLAMLSWVSWRYSLKVVGKHYNLTIHRLVGTPVCCDIMQGGLTGEVQDTGDPEVPPRA